MVSLAWPCICLAMVLFRCVLRTANAVKDLPSQAPSLVDLVCPLNPLVASRIATFATKLIMLRHGIDVGICIGKGGFIRTIMCECYYGIVLLRICTLAHLWMCWFGLCLPTCVCYIIFS